MTLRSPYQWFGNKRQITDAIWSRLGSPDAFVEPFFGSGAILLARPNEPKLEVVNDLDGLLCNFWRAIKLAPEETARQVAYPPSELDIMARHGWIMSQGISRVRALREDPFAYDTQTAAWWVWGLAAYVGGGWCDGKSHLNQDFKIPAMSSMGVHRTELDGDVDKIAHYFKQLAWRLRNVKIACGDWSRLLTPAVTTQHGITGVVLDPPYEDAEHSIQYAGGGGVAQDVRFWCIENGENSKLRIALCGYESDRYKMPDTWETLPWKASGGYGNQGEGRGRDNAGRERVWFSPHCLKPHLRQSLFSEEIPEKIDWKEREDYGPNGDGTTPGFMLEGPVVAHDRPVCPPITDVAVGGQSRKTGDLFDREEE